MSPPVALPGSLSVGANRQERSFSLIERAFKPLKIIFGNAYMAQNRSCPSCGENESFTQVATTTLNLGEKTKWRCDACGYRSIRIGSAIDTAEA